MHVVAADVGVSVGFGWLPAVGAVWHWYGAVYTVFVTDDTLETLAAFQARMDKMPARRAELIREARAAGHSWREIGATLGMSHVGAMKASRIV